MAQEVHELQVFILRKSELLEEPLVAAQAATESLSDDGTHLRTVQVAAHELQVNGRPEKSLSTGT
jgi:hypothetical protein